MSAELRRKVASYLLDGRRTSRIEAFDMLAERGWFTSGDEIALVRYLKENPTNACADGIERFKTAVGVGRQHAIVRVILDVEISDPHAAFPGHDGSASGALDDITAAVRRIPRVKAVARVGYEGRWSDREPETTITSQAAGWPFDCKRGETR